MTRDEAEEALKVVEAELEPYTITLTGEEAIKLAGMTLVWRAGEDRVKVLMKALAQELAKGVPVEEAVNDIVEAAAETGQAFPPWFAGLWIHCIKKTVEVKNRKQ